jgi:MFS family permease
VSENYISYLFGIRALAYGCMSMTTSKLCELLSRRVMILSGILLIGIANAFMGSCSLLNIPQSISSVCVGIAFNGVGCSFIFVASFPELVTMALSKINKTNNSILIDRAAGMYFATFNSGYLLAPVMSGIIVARKTFEYACNVMLIADILIALLFLFAFLIYKDKLL